MDKKVWVGFVVTFIGFALLDMVVNMFLMSGAYEQSAHLWRQPEDIKWGVYVVTLAIFSFLYVFIFSKGYQGKGIAEGTRYGLYIGLMFNVTAAYMTYAFMPVEYSFALQWFLYGTTQSVIVGTLVGWVFSMKPKEASAS
jgi:xanthine/uracil permease